MKNESFRLLLAATILGVSMIISSVILTYSKSATNDQTQSANIISQEQIGSGPLMTIKETSEFMHLTESQIRKIISTEENLLKTSGSYTGKRFPYMTIDNEIYVSTKGLEEWIKESVQQSKQY
ncbi:DNA-binding protein [Cohnella sp. 56]|uniref:DNA-binding protein n=1 Tax=Cohnella sp. 56 TaxID=3113722 RepID=UPI0030EA8056